MHAPIEGYIYYTIIIAMKLIYDYHHYHIC